MAKRSNTQAAGLALIRVLAGCIFFGRGWSWLTGEGMDGAIVLEHARAALERQSGLLHWWGSSVVLANPDASAFFWRWGALLIGIAFLLGALTRPAGILACFFLWQGMLYGPDAHAAYLSLLLMICLGCALGSAGRSFGIDKALDESLPGWLTWTKHRRGSGLFS